MIILVFLLLVFFVAMLVTLFLFAAAWYDHVNFSQKADSLEWRKKINVFAIIRAVVWEACSFFVVLLSIPLHFYYDRDPKSRRQPGQHPILLVHGWGGSSNDFLAVRYFLKRTGFSNVYAISYRPVTADAAELAARVAEKVDSILKATGSKQIVLITHSMGGVLARYAIKNLGLEGKVHTVISLGGPHLGSRVAAFAPFGKNTLQMTYQSKFIMDLAHGGMTPGSARYVSIYSNFDNCVLPPASSDLGPEATNYKVPYHGHAALLFSTRVMQLIVQELRYEVAGENAGA